MTVFSCLRTALVVALVLVAGCSSGAADGVRRGDAERSTGSTTTAATDPTSTLPPVDASIADGRTPIPGFGEVGVRVTTGAGDSLPWCLLLAATEVQRERGLMEVTDRTLGGYDGMLFRYDADTTVAFWMRNTPMPLSIAYLAAGGALVTETDMVPCGDTPNCPSYPPTAPYRMALEVPEGGLARLGIGGTSRLQVTGRCAPKATPTG